MADSKAGSKTEGGASYTAASLNYFEDRELRRHAGVFYLWALGVAAVISGDFSGWNLGFAVGGWGGMFCGAVIITIMYLGLTYSIAEMSPAAPIRSPAPPSDPGAASSPGSPRTSNTC
jgi:ethanolamine permease